MMGNKLNLRNIPKNEKVYVWEGSYAMVKAKDLEKALACMEKLGFMVEGTKR